MYTQEQIDKIWNWLDAESTNESHQARDIIAFLCAENARLREVLRLAWRAYGIWLPTDPPQEAWKTWGVADKIRALLSSQAPEAKGESGEELRKAIEGLLDAANRNVGGMTPGGIAGWCHKALALLARKTAEERDDEIVQSMCDRDRESD